MNNLATSNLQASPVIRELETAELPLIKPLILALNQSLSGALFDEYLQQISVQQYRCIGLFIDEELVGIAGLWIFTRFWCGKQCDVDNVIIAESHRRKGYAKKLMAYAESLAQEEACDIMVLDSYRNATQAHTFYETLGYFAKGYHFIKPISASCPASATLD